MAWTRKVRESFWVVPGVMCLVAAVAAQGLVGYDRSLADAALDGGVPLVYRAGADGSREVLGAIAGSMLAVASTTFSITIAVLALTSSSYGPRLVRNFMADRGNQLVLGTYVATYLYTLLVLRSIRTLDGDEEAFVPQLAVNGAVLLAVLSIGVLVWFIHHISDSIQVWTLAGRVHGELRAVVADLYPEQVGAAGADDVRRGDEAVAGPPTHVVRSTRAGYVQQVAHDRLVAEARRCEVVVELLVRPGSFVVETGELAAVHGTTGGDDGDDGDDGERLADRVRRCLPLSEARSPAQDVEFATQQLVEMLVRALSPGTNDPYTAVNALDELSDGLAAMARRGTPSPVRLDEDGQVRVVAPGVGLPQLVDLTVDAVRTYGRDHPDVVLRTVDVLGRIGAGASEADRTHLRRRLDLLLDHVCRGEVHPFDETRLREESARVGALLSAPHAGAAGR